MEALFEKQDALLRATNLQIVRSFINHVNWDAPLLCIRGPRGVGKSTLLRQYIKLHYPPETERALYCSLDWVYFSQNSIMEVARKFHQHGGELLVLDEVHKYVNWSREVKEISELYPDLKIILSGSSLLSLMDGDADLSRRCRNYDMPGLSFCEYLQFYQGISINPVSLEEILRNPRPLADQVNSLCRPLEHFHKYLREGYYPFYLNNPIDYYPLIEQTISYVIDVELPQLRGVRPENCRKLKALLNVLSQEAPFEVETTKLAGILEITRNTLIDYLNWLGDAHLLSLLYSDLKSVKKLQKPDKIFVDNTNLLHAISCSEPNIGTLRECFAVNQLKHGHTVEYSRTKRDFKVDGRWLFEIGGARKSFNQSADIPDSYILADDIEYPRGNKLPLWMIGFLY